MGEEGEEGEEDCFAWADGEVRPRNSRGFPSNGDVDADVTRRMRRLPNTEGGASRERGVHAGRGEEGPCICRDGDKGGPGRCLAGWREAEMERDCEGTHTEPLVTNAHRWGPCRHTSCRSVYLG